MSGLSEIVFSFWSLVCWIVATVEMLSSPAKHLNSNKPNTEIIVFPSTSLNWWILIYFCSRTGTRTSSLGLRLRPSHNIFIREMFFFWRSNSLWWFSHSFFFGELRTLWLPKENFVETWAVYSSFGIVADWSFFFTYTFKYLLRKCPNLPQLQHLDGSLGYTTLILTEYPTESQTSTNSEGETSKSISILTFVSPYL